jgi:hypothetical protein
MNANFLKAIMGLLLLVPLSFMIGYIYECVFSAFNMENRITFSASILSVAIATPAIYYVLFSAIYILCLSKLPGYHELINKWLLKLLIVSVVVSPFTSMYITYKATNNGYIECEKISWMSPNNFVKPPETCN